MSDVLIAGLPGGLASWLARRLPEALVQVTYSGEETVDELRAGRWSLLLIDESLPGLPAGEVVRWMRTEAALAGVRVVFCVEIAEGEDPARTEERLERLDADRILLHPLDRGELTRHAAELLSRAPRETVALSAALPGPRAPAPPPPPGEHELRSAVAAVWERSRGAILERVAVLERAVASVLEGTLRGPQRHEAEREAHRLTGALGTFGFPEGSRLALLLEQSFGGGARLGPGDGARLGGMVADLRRELERAPGAPAGLPAAPAPTPAAGGRPLLLVVDDDEAVARVLAEAGERRGLEVASAPGPAAARELLAARRPDAVLLDLSFAAGEEDGHDFLAELERLAPGVPVLVVTGRGSLVDRVRALQLGARGFLRKPFDPARAVDAAARLVPGLHPAAAVHVLAVDDDPQVLDALGALLEPHGIRVHGVGNPLRFWTALEETSPDLVVLDVDMPHLNGIELCRVLRSDVRRAALPVLFLTASTSADTVYRVFAAGADDYVSKPIVGPELVARIRNRLERVAATRAPAGGG